MAELWKEILVDDEPMDYLWSEFPSIFTQNADNAFYHRSDFVNKVRPKENHTQGVVAQVEWKPVENMENYTGIYETGSQAVLLRLSQTKNLTAYSPGLLPSLALKFLRDGDESENLFAMPNFTGTDSWDFFQQPLKNKVAPFDEEKHAIEIATI